MADEKTIKQAVFAVADAIKPFELDELDTLYVLTQTLIGQIEYIALACEIKERSPEERMKILLGILEKMANEACEE